MFPLQQLIHMATENKTKRNIKPGKSAPWRLCGNLLTWSLNLTSLTSLDCVMAQAARTRWAAGEQRHRGTSPRYKHQADLREGVLLHCPGNIAQLRGQTLSLLQL